MTDTITRTSLSLGIKSPSGVFVKLIERNTSVPATATTLISTVSDDQGVIEISVFEGERGMADDNKLLGVFTLEGIPPAPRGVPHVEIRFHVDANSILIASARETKTGKEQRVCITSLGCSSAHQLRSLLDEADRSAEADKTRCRLAQSLHDAHQAIAEASTFLSCHDVGITQTQLAEVEKATTDLRNSIQTNRPSAIDESRVFLVNLLRKLEPESEQTPETGDEE